MRDLSLKTLYEISLDAGKEIMDIYQHDFDVEFKEDDSPLTLADQRAHEVIVKGLKEAYQDIPVLSEEGANISYEERKGWKQFWLVDPLDGTKEFIKKNGEFTVNIALIENGYPVAGVIYAPALDIFYFGVQGQGAYKLIDASLATIHNDQILLDASEPLPLSEGHEGVYVVASRSHMSEETQQFVEDLKEKIDKVETISSGSSLKFCLVAEGKADFYPRYAPTMEWDTGAGQAIVEASGGSVKKYKDRQRFKYNKENLLNSWFLVSR